MELGGSAPGLRHQQLTVKLSRIFLQVARDVLSNVPSAAYVSSHTLRSVTVWGTHSMNPQSSESGITANLHCSRECQLQFHTAHSCSWR